MFGVPPFDQTELEAGNEKFETIQRMWSTVKLWGEKETLWNESQFTDLQVEDIAKEVDIMFKDSYALNKKLNSKVSEKLRDKISEFKSIVPNILDLGNPNMRTRHFEKLFAMMKVSYYPDMPFTLDQLLKGIPCMSFFLPFLPFLPFKRLVN